MPANESANISYHFAVSESIQRFAASYRPIHGYLAILVCAFGVVSNIFIIVVLTRKIMVSPTNFILTSLAVSDGLTMLAYLPFASHFYVRPLHDSPSTDNVYLTSLPSAYFMLLYACFSVVMHTISIWVTVTLALFRYLCVKYPKIGLEYCSLRRAHLAVLLICLVTVVVCIPNFRTVTVRPSNISTSGNTSALSWRVAFRSETDFDVLLGNFNFWIQAVLVKLIPCLGLVVLSLLLTRTMNVAETRRQSLRNYSATKVVVRVRWRVDGTGRGGGVNSSSANHSGRKRKINRTTRMLLAVVVLFLATEFPQGILNLLSGLLTHFVEEIYDPLGDLMDIAVLVNSGINFVLYCLMSKQFRSTFVSTFVPARCLKRTSGVAAYQLSTMASTQILAGGRNTNTAVYIMAD